MSSSESTSTSPPTSSHRHHQHHQATPLPTINIPKFSGKLTDWATFWDYFTSLIIQNNSLDNLQRLHFLKSLLESEAASLLKGISLTENNFVTAWDRLKDRFENPRAIVQAELKSLFAIQSMKNDSLAALKTIRNIVTERIAALENLGRFPSLNVVPENRSQSDGVSDILVFLVSQKLDANTRLAWELQLGNTTEYPHFPILLKFIDSRIRVMEAVQRNDENKPRLEPVRSHVVSVGNCCPLCDLVHKIFTCSEFKKKSAEQRFHFVKSKRLCLNCLKRGHSASTCASSFSCAQCQAKHHTLLHFKRDPNKKESKPAPNNGEDSGASSQHTDASEVAQLLHIAPRQLKPYNVLLATAKMIVSSELGRSVKIRALLDQGSTWTFVTTTLVNALKIRPTRLNDITLLGLGNVSAGESRYMAPAVLRSRTGQGSTFSTNALFLKNLTNYVPRICSDVLKNPYLQNLELADGDITGSQPIHMIIGADLYGSILRNGLRQGHPDEPVAQNSAFGWIISGKTIDLASKKPLHNLTEVVAHHCVSSVDLNKSIQKFWEIEEIYPFAGYPRTI